MSRVDLGLKGSERLTPASSMSAAIHPSAPVVTLERRKVERDLRLSEGLLVAGMALYAVVFAVWQIGWFTTNGSGNFATQVLVLNALQGTAGVLILVGAIFTAINWSLLRKARTTLPRPSP
ncbi:MAG TPA: hypothetical protein VN864_07415 [Thermoplasmata archaeon]|nr:hypothetical protein [Thermoplasmata archaeon]